MWLVLRLVNGFAPFVQVRALEISLEVPIEKVKRPPVRSHPAGLARRTG
jgi:hypothetical protein